MKNSKREEFQIKKFLKKSRSGLRWMVSIADGYFALGLQGLFRKASPSIRQLQYSIARRFPFFFFKFGGAIGSEVLLEHKVTSHFQTDDLGSRKSSRPSVLVIHALDSGSRQTTIDFVSSFWRHARGCEVTYINILGPSNYPELNDDFDLAIVMYDALSLRSSVFWPDIRRRIVKLSAKSKNRFLFPQDDYTRCALLDELAVDGGFDHVWTPITQDLKMLYPLSIENGISFSQALTGYAEEDAFGASKGANAAYKDRPIDVGQRVRKLGNSYGLLGFRKFELADIFATEARRRSLNVDFSSEDSDVLLGEAWIRFLGNCKSTISRMGGASIADTRGLLQRALSHGKVKESDIPLVPDLRFQRKFKLRVGNFSAISPRIFEAAAAGVCQILEEDIYLSGTLEPGVHYISLKSDFSNLEEVFSLLQDESYCEQIIANATGFLVDSDVFSYRKFVERVIGESGINPSTDAMTERLDLDLKYLGDVALFSNESSYTRYKLRVLCSRIPFLQQRRSGSLASLRSLTLSEQYMLNKVEGGFESSFMIETLTNSWVGVSHFVSKI